MEATGLKVYAALADGSCAAVLAALLFVAAMLYAAQRDLRTLTIPNGLIVALLLGWSLLAPAAGLTPREMTLNIGAAAMVFFVTVAFYATGWMGGGDSKLLTVCALWLGAGQVAPFLMATLIAGAGLALCIAALRLMPRALPRGARGAGLQALAVTEIPYALAIGLAALGMFPRSFWAGAL